MKSSLLKSFKWLKHLLAAPETNLFIFAFLIHFVYEVWQSPYFEFYGMPTLADKINYITHCTIGDGVITVLSSGIISFWQRNRYWMITPTARLIVIFTSIGWIYTFISEIYRVRVAQLYGVSVLVVPFVQISWLPLLQWLILPPMVLMMTRRHLLGYRSKIE
ncbi:hypothetical protein [Chroococcus sp. FPU101]|uniref:hypothetical protein n=1 Tax=Chroococcus sp. FPU101 TaxID=1974212 RepID=UPI001A8CB411|nr:hypothetical protein [Chroococcus sp. FPU101]GFE69112.1 hypothetical protein CFPU101_17220 [Chroococcus sp. FPU101]